MKKALILFLSVTCILTSLSSCVNPDNQLKIDLSETTEIEVLHYLGGKEERRVIDDKADIDNVTTWFNNLAPVLKQFEQGNSPGDSDGGEVYYFTFDNDDFSYVINGPDECYILYNSDWYQVENPMAPFDY